MERPGNSKVSEKRAKKVHVRTGDVVLVLKGKDRGKRGKVLRVIPKEGRVVVEGVNVVKRHTKPSRKVMQGGIIEKEAPISSSKVMLICPRCQEPSRMGKRRLGIKELVRVCKKCGEVIDK